MLLLTSIRRRMLRRHRCRSRSLEKHSITRFFSGAVGKCRLGDADENQHLLPSSQDLAGAEVEMMNIKGREYLLSKLVARLRPYYDYILIRQPAISGASHGERTHGEAMR